MDRYLEILRRHWGYTAFRPLQAEIIRSVCQGRDTLGLMATGAGKSITFQVSALGLEGVCLVITPLIALMKDQVDHLQIRGLSAVMLHAGMRREQIKQTLEDCISGKVKFLYLAPERLFTPLFKDYVKQLRLCSIVVDEAHCISQWGYDFRPAYLRIAELRADYPNVPILALTGSATPQVQQDIVEKLHMRNPQLFQTSYARPNITFRILKDDDKFLVMCMLLKAHPGSAIVFVRYRHFSHEVATCLRNKGFSARCFHAGLLPEEKAETQALWLQNKCRIIVATNAFGMGIDKPDVRLVIHLNVPNSLEGYYQEAGRAGRDGQPALAIVFWNFSERVKLIEQMHKRFPTKEFIFQVYKHLGHFLKLQPGQGKGALYPFSFERFRHNYALPIAKAKSALDFLKRCGYIEHYYPEDDLTSVWVNGDRDYLLKRFIEHPEDREFLANFFRFRRQVYFYFIPIDEDWIAEKTGDSIEHIHERFQEMIKLNMLKYRPARDSEFMYFPKEYVPIEEVNIPPAVYEERLKQHKKRLDAVLYYMEQDRFCRNQLLLNYFGEKNVEPCHRCDCCLRSQEEYISEEEFDEIHAALLKVVTATPQSIYTILEQLPQYSIYQTTTVLRFLAHEGHPFHLCGSYISYG